MCIGAKNPKFNNTPTVLHLLMSPYMSDSRVMNETNTLAENGYSVQVFCLKGGEMPEYEERGKVAILRGGIGSQKFVTLVSGWIAMVQAARRFPVEVVHAHDLTALPVAYVISKMKKIPYVYDSHELWSHAHHQIENPLVLYLANQVESYLAKRAETIITVSNSIGRYLEKYLEVRKVEVIRNLPSYVHTGKFNLFREEFGIPQEKVIFLYQGLLSEERGVDKILQAANVMKHRDDFVLVILGSGPYLQTLKGLVSELGLEELVILKDQVEQGELLKYTASADVGIHAIPGTCLNHEYCLPNKLFEYMSAGLAVVVTDLTEMKKFVEENEIGLVFKDGSDEDLANKLEEILFSKAGLERMKSAARKVNKSINWDIEAEKLLAIYKNICR
jgi:glycosyltransferase involved in cell wall biosynthesis